MAVALVVVIFVLAPHYNDAQRATTAAAFRDVVGDDRGRFALVAWLLARRQPANASS